MHEDFLYSSDVLRAGYISVVATWRITIMEYVLIAVIYSFCGESVTFPPVVCHEVNDIRIFEVIHIFDLIGSLFANGRLFGVDLHQIDLKDGWYP